MMIIMKLIEVTCAFLCLFSFSLSLSLLPLIFLCDPSMLPPMKPSRIPRTAGQSSPIARDAARLRPATAAAAAATARAASGGSRPCLTPGIPGCCGRGSKALPTVGSGCGCGCCSCHGVLRPKSECRPIGRTQTHIPIHIRIHIPHITLKIPDLAYIVSVLRSSSAVAHGQILPQRLFFGVPFAVTSSNHTPSIAAHQLMLVILVLQDAGRTDRLYRSGFPGPQWWLFPHRPDCCCPPFSWLCPVSFVSVSS